MAGIGSGANLNSAVPNGGERMANMYDFTMNSITGEPVDLRTFENQVCLVVNVASE